MIRCLSSIGSLCLALAGSCWAAEPSFNREVRPILAAKCFACHGPDAEHRQADLRLDTRDSALEQQAFVPGKPDSSELVQRVISRDADLRMPPPPAPSLSQQEQEVLSRWVASGAAYDRHWAFESPVRPPVPRVREQAWARTPIDHFILAALEARDLAPSAEADRYTLIRRLYLDLIGLNPTPQQADQFVRDADPLAYQKIVDRLLASSQYGEHWARGWLDLARYSDTNGYEKDRPRSVWPYRDWVIRALSQDMPFDEFTVQQIAGDMLQHATEDQRIATGFHRNTMLNEEGGIDPLEFRYHAMVDRVATTGTVWLGLTVGCAQCHNHKYDPISQVDYFAFMGLLNNADEPELIIQDANIERRRNQKLQQIALLESELWKKFPPADGTEPLPLRRRKNIQSRFSEWLDRNQQQVVGWRTMRPAAMSTNLPRLELLQDGSVFSTGDITKRDVYRLRFDLADLTADAPITAIRLEVLPDDRLPAQGPGRCYYEGRKGDFFLSEISTEVDGISQELVEPSHTYGKLGIGNGGAAATNVLDGDGSTGWSTSGQEGKSNQLVLNFSKPIASSGELILEMLFERHYAAGLGRFRWSCTTDVGRHPADPTPVDVQVMLKLPASRRTQDQNERLMRQFLREAKELEPYRKEIEALRASLPAYPVTMVMQERAQDNPRPTFRHHRGEYLSPRDRVAPGLPALLTTRAGPLPSNRMELARWLVSTENPLVGRVTMNRLWRAFFGHGIVNTSGDFGTQSDPPSHPELIDWLAVEFRESGWSLKRMQRMIVLSATYRQQSHVTDSQRRRDPSNRLYGRGTRFRLPAESVRDIMLQASGVLSTKRYGRGVYPQQPASVMSLAYGSPSWSASNGEDRYRRSIYTFRKRTAPFAAFAVFDAPSGENCMARRNRSNTPLQALTTLNDRMFQELSVGMAKRVIASDPESDQHTATALFRTLLVRPPDQDELQRLLEFERVQRDRLSRGDLSAKAILREEGNAIELAAWSMVARAIMNLDETINRP